MHPSVIQISMGAYRTLPSSIILLTVLVWLNRMLPLQRIDSFSQGATENAVSGGGQPPDWFTNPIMYARIVVQDAIVTSRKKQKSQKAPMGRALSAIEMMADENRE